MRHVLLISNLSLLILFPLAWSLPLLRSGLDLPFFGLEEISVLSGIGALWQSDPALAVLIAALALVSPYAKTLALAALHLGFLSARALPLLHLLGKLAMADIFLLALYIVIARGVSFARIETAPGLYLFTLCVLASLVLSLASRGRR
ncbi:paraquat-inducible protein A [Szabonella alba]|uniref:Paraquat-inducible protein A n=1 Tax=Szabonella alba TaxID=2804194 RepID=A0A8K0VGT2_9RHOB|nr:paraquat-inducible protein A [Szabonella alba]MBL4918790.1 paraquat-inducible protein A [Szabonella alba]